MLAPLAKNYFGQRSDKRPWKCFSRPSAIVYAGKKGTLLKLESTVMILTVSKKSSWEKNGSEAMNLKIELASGEYLPNCQPTKATHTPGLKKFWKCTTNPMLRIESTHLNQLPN